MTTPTLSSIAVVSVARTAVQAFRKLFTAPWSASIFVPPLAPVVGDAMLPE